MRIVVVADGDPRSKSTNSGVAVGLTEALEGRDDAVVVGTIDSRPHGLWKLVMLVLSFRFSRSAWRNEFHKGPLSTLSRSIIRDRALRKIAKRGQVDVVIHVRNTYRPTRAHYVSFLDNTGLLSQDGWPDWRLGRRSFQRRLHAERTQFDRAIAVYTAAENVARSVIGDYGQSPSKVRAVGGGTNLAPKDDNRTRTHAGFTVLFVGRDFERKGGVQLIEAFERLAAESSGCRLIIVGPVELPEGLTDRSWVEFHGRVSDRQRLSEIYTAADIFCLPAIYEPYGLVVQEALAHGLPCVVSNVGALPDIIGHGIAGTVVQTGDAQELFEALSSYESDHDLLSRKRAGIESVRAEASWDRVADRMITHLKSALSESRWPHLT